MSLFHRKSKFERVVDSLESNEMLKSAALRAVESAVASGTSSKQAEKVNQAIAAFDSGHLRRSGGFGSVVKTGLVMTVGVAALTAVSASISNVRQRTSST